MREIVLLFVHIEGVNEQSHKDDTHGSLAGSGGGWGLRGSHCQAHERGNDEDLHVCFRLVI